MNLAGAFISSARTHTRKTAVFWGESELTYEHLLQETLRAAATLSKDFGIQKGMRVGLLLKNQPDFIPVFFGVVSLGAIIVPINNFLKAPEISFILKDAGVNLLITEESFAEMLPLLAADLPGLQSIMAASLVGAEVPVNSHCPVFEPVEQDDAVLIYTSGTTGRPKGAILTHGNLLHNVESCRKVLLAVDHDRFALLLPMFHSFMLCVCILLPLIVGGSIVLIKSLNQPKAIMQEIALRKPTILPAIPPFFRTMLDPAVPATLPLRLCISGAAPLPVQLLREFNQKFSFPLLEGYGLSEASPVVSINPIPGPWKAGSIGRAIPDVEVRIRSDDGRWLDPPDVGELCVRGGNVMQGYWNQPAASAEALHNGWLLTGDVGYMDAEGYIYITDRKKDMLLVNGNNVYPREIEEVLYEFPGIKEAAVIGQPDPRKGEQPLAFVAVHNGQELDERGVVQFLRGRLADYKVPRRVVQLAALPRNGTGKILKTELRKIRINNLDQSV